MMQKILITTDIHIVEHGARIIGLDPVERFQAVLNKAAHEHSDAECMIITGDIAHHGLEQEYTRFADCIRDLPWPVHVTIGNHDDRTLFCEAFPNALLTPDGFVQETVDLDGWRLIILDTNDNPGAVPAHSGYLCSHRLSWLKEQLAGAEGRKVVIFLHHPPMPTFFDGMDEIGLRNSDALLAILRGYPNVVQIVGGHVHRTISGVSGGLPVTVFKSPCHQMSMELGPSSCHSSINEPGAFGILLLHENGVTIHSEDVL